jgi:hypothetical protein
VPTPCRRPRGRCRARASRFRTIRSTFLGLCPLCRRSCRVYPSRTRRRHQGQQLDLAAEKSHGRKFKRASHLWHDNPADRRRSRWRSVRLRAAEKAERANSLIHRDAAKVRFRSPKCCQSSALRIDSFRFIGCLVSERSRPLSHPK